MKCLQTSNDLNKNIPNFLFFYISFSLLIAAYFLEDVSVVGVLHNKAAKQMVSEVEGSTYHKLLLGSSMNASL